MNHILPKEYISTLAVLQDRALPQSFPEIEELFREEFGQTPDELFRTFDRTPIAAASLAQVYHAVTYDNQVGPLRLGSSVLRGPTALFV